VNSFSEFWFNGGGTGGNTPLPVRLVDFTATRKAAQVVLRWTTADEHNVARYDIEVARGNEDLKKARFETIGAVESNGNTTAQRQYGFVDNEGFKSGVRYYRLKMWDNDGTFRYSGVRSVLFSNTLSWQVAPNPSAGVFQLVYQAAANEDVPVRIVDLTGRTVQTAQLHANGFVQKRTFDLTAQPPGVYLLHVHRNGALQSFKLYKR
jgi:leucyl aminopeptidase (aminopeptidase T)